MLTLLFSTNPCLESRTLLLLAFFSSLQHTSTPVFSSPARCAWRRNPHSPALHANVSSRLQATGRHTSPAQIWSLTAWHQYRTMVVQDRGKRKDPEGSENLCTLPCYRAASGDTHQPFHSASSPVPNGSRGRHHLCLVRASLGSAVLTHKPCGRDLSITSRFDQGSTP